MYQAISLKPKYTFVQAYHSYFKIWINIYPWSQDMFEPDNPLVKNEMDDDFKKELTALQDLKSQLGTSNTRE